MKKAATGAGPAPSLQKKLVALARKRLRQFATLTPEFLVSDHPDIVHDLRVASRRLQQALRALYSGSKPPKSKKVSRMLRRTRRALGPCRNLDVNLDLIKKKQQRAGAAAVQRAWRALRTRLETERGPLFESARREVQGQDLFGFISRAQGLIEAAQGPADPYSGLENAIVESMAAWQTAFGLATEQRDPVNLHQFRVAGKRLRYRVELLAALEPNKTKPMVDALKQLQDDLGDWHDRTVLVESVAKFIAEPEFLASHADLARVLLTEIEKETLHNDAAVERFLSDAAKVPELWARWKSAPTVTAPVSQ